MDAVDKAKVCVQALLLLAETSFPSLGPPPHPRYQALEKGIWVHCSFFSAIGSSQNSTAQRCI